jgi:hypothetical protein
MKVSEKNIQAHAKKIADAVKVLMEYGLPDPVSPYLRDIEKEFGRPAREIDPKHVGVPVTAAGRGVSVDLTAVAPDKILIAMFNAVWQKGVEEGQRMAEASQAEALLEAFPTLKATIRELAEDVADRKIDEFRERFQN